MPSVCSRPSWRRHLTGILTGARRAQRRARKPTPRRSEPSGTKAMWRLPMDEQGRAVRGAIGGGDRELVSGRAATFSLLPLRACAVWLGAW